MVFVVEIVAVVGGAIGGEDGIDSGRGCRTGST